MNTFLHFFIPLLSLACFFLEAKPSFDELQNKEERQELFLLITGCARSGTTYISEVLQRCGLDVGHEIIGKDGCSSWFMNVEAKSAPWNRPTGRGLKFQHIFHQVRNPLDVISSVTYAEHRLAKKFFRLHIPEIKPTDSVAVQSAKYWYYWNLKAEQKAEWRYRVEDIDYIFEEMSQRLGFSLNKEILQEVSRTTNHRHSNYKKFTWKDLEKLLPEDLFHNIKDMSQRYSYPTEDSL